VTVSTQHLQVNSGGDAGSFTVVLNSKPAAEVDVTLKQFNLSFPAEMLAAASGENGGPAPPTGGATTLTLDPTHLAFTPDNWNQPQTVKVSAPAGSSPSGGSVVWIYGTTTSTDASFDGQAVPPVTVSVLGSNAVNPAGLTLGKTNLVVQRGGAGDSYTIALTSKPTADVTATISQVGRGEGGPTLAGAGAPVFPWADTQLTITPSTVTFTAGDWDKPQTVQVSAPAGEESYPEGVLLFQAVTSRDPNYNNLVVPPVTVRVENNTSVGVVLSKEHLQVTRGGAGDSYTVALASKPTANVTITVAQANPNQPVTFVGDGPGDCPIVAPPWPYDRDPLTISPTTLTFTPDNWIKPQTVTVGPPTTGSGEQIDLILMTAASDDKNYDGLRLPVVTVAVADNSAAKGTLVLSTQHLDVTEGAPAASYTIALASKPTADVTVTISQVSPVLDPPGYAAPGEGGILPRPIPLGGPQLTITPTTLKFTADNWDKPQTVQASAPASAANTPSPIGDYGAIVFLEHQTASSDPNYNGVQSPPVIVHVEDTNTNPGGAVLSKDHVEVTRGGAGDSFTVALTSKPTANVSVSVFQVDALAPPGLEGIPDIAARVLPGGHDPLVITPTTLTFTPDNWHKPQTVQVGPPTSGSGDQFEFIGMTAASDDKNYDGRHLPMVSVSVVDSSAQEAGLVVSQHELDVTRGGSAASFTIALASKPSANVTVTLNQVSPEVDPLAASGSGGSTGPLTVTPTTLTFTPDNWDKPQIVQVSAPAVTGPNQPEFVILEQQVASDDPNYKGLSSPPVLVRIEDSTLAGKAGVVISTDQLEVTPGGPAASYTIALASKPTADVTITIAQVSEFMPPLAVAKGSGGDGGAPGATGGNVVLTITPTTLTFTADNWNKPQTVQVSAPSQSGQGGAFAQVDWLVSTVASKDTAYNGLFVPPLAVAVVMPGQKVVVPPILPPPLPWVSFDTPDPAPAPVLVSPPASIVPGSPGAGSKPAGNGHGSGAGAAPHHGQTNHNAHHARKGHHGKH
jgi:hypothetical protein